MTKTTISIDNGCTGSLAIFSPDGTIFETMPVKEQLMGKNGKKIKRIDHENLSLILGAVTEPVHAFIERPFTGGAMMVNVAVLSARAFEAVIIVLEQLGIGYTVTDSKTWQAAMLGSVKGSANLKVASKLRAMEMFPKHAATVKKHKDGDSLLMGSFYHSQP